MIGERVDDWVIEAALGENAHGRSFLAHAADASGTMAVIHALTSNPAINEVFRGRLNLLRKLSHPNLVAYLGSGIVHADPYYVTEFVDGPNCESLLREGKRPGWPEVLAIGIQSVAALRHAHRRSVLHGDLKPANVLRAPDGSIKLAECGVSRLFSNDVTPPGDNPLASAAFISPEQAAGKPTTKRSDFYSLGCLLYALLTGRPPFMATNLVELIHKLSFVVPERPIHYLPDLPEELDALVMKLLAKDPQVRPGSGTLLLAEFDRVWASLESRGKLGKRPALAPDDPMPLPAEEAAAAPSTIAIVPARAPRPILSRASVVIPLFLLVIGAFIGGFYLTRSDPDEMWARAQPLMHSSDPADWEKAWDEYLEPISRNHPDKYADEIKAFEARMRPAAELRRAQASGRAAIYSSEAERFYQEGVRLCQAGDFAAARRLWERVVAGFAGIESEAHWVELARQASARMPTQEGALNRPGGKAAVQAALDRARALRTEGKAGEANAVLDALDALYRDDPDGAEIHVVIQKERNP